MRVAASLALLSVQLLLALAKPHTEGIPSRDDMGHFMNDPGRHDFHVDHKAFLGSETAHEYSKLTREQSQQKLKDIVHKIDVSRDGNVDVDELRSWITQVAQRNIHQVSMKRWQEVNPSGVDPLPWDQYIETAYGKPEERLSDPVGGEDYKKTVRQDRRRWEAADVNRDGMLSVGEFVDFLFPEDKDHMKGAVIDDLLEAVDMDHDGRVSEREYLEDLARVYQTPLDSEPEPSWLVNEKDQFRKYRDNNGDGFLDREEIGEWIMPHNYDSIDAETQHLFFHADSNKDGILSMNEILDNQDYFVSSQATNYGTVFEDHSEL